MRTTLSQFNETTSTDAFALQNTKLLKVSLDQVTIQAKLGSMVAYQGDVRSSTPARAAWRGCSRRPRPARAPA